MGAANSRSQSAEGGLNDDGFMAEVAIAEGFGFPDVADFIAPSRYLEETTSHAHFFVDPAILTWASSDLI